MAAWIPILKATLPLLTQVVATTLPAFTAKPESSKADPVTVKQIEELQTAATQNAESIRVLAEKLQQTIEGIENTAVDLHKQNAMLKKTLVIMSVLVVIALAVSIVGLTV